LLFHDVFRHKDKSRKVHKFKRMELCETMLKSS
jgi:hypothetical protein